MKPQDTLWNLADRFGTTLAAILEANIICNPNYIYVGEPIIISEPGLNLPRSGGSPYYVVLPGDTLWCLANQLHTTVQVLASINQLPDPDVLPVGKELLIAPEIPDSDQLFATWVNTAEQSSCSMNSLQVHGIYYLGSFQWAALGARAVPHLLTLLESTCNIVRYYAAISLGRIALDGNVKGALEKHINDPDSSVAEVAQLALRRIRLAKARAKRIHLITSATDLFTLPEQDAPKTTLPQGTEVIVTRWHIPSPTGEELPPGGLAIWDQIKLARYRSDGVFTAGGLRGHTAALNQRCLAPINPSPDGGFSSV